MSSVCHRDMRIPNVGRIATLCAASSRTTENLFDRVEQTSHICSSLGFFLGLQTLPKLPKGLKICQEVRLAERSAAEERQREAPLPPLLNSADSCPRA